VVARGERIRLEATASFDGPVTGLKVRGTVTGPDGEVEEIELFDDGEPKHGSELAGSGHLVNLWNPSRTGVHVFDLVADNRDGRAVSGSGGVDRSGGSAAPAAVPVPAFMRRTRFTVRVGDPIGDGARAKPARLRQGVAETLTVRLDGRPWIPGVSRLGLGPGVRVEERLRDSTPEEAVFDVVVEDRAAPGPRTAKIVTQGGRYEIEDLVEITGEEPEPLKITPERRRFPGRYRLRRLRGWFEPE
jgi:hypothetical protein